METGRQEIETDSSTELSCGYCFDCSIMTETYLNVCRVVSAVSAEKYPSKVVNMHCSPGSLCWSSENFNRTCTNRLS